LPLRTDEMRCADVAGTLRTSLMILINIQLLDDDSNLKKTGASVM